MVITTKTKVVVIMLTRMIFRVNIKTSTLIIVYLPITHCSVHVFDVRWCYWMYFLLRHYCLLPLALLVNLRWPHVYAWVRRLLYLIFRDRLLHYHVNVHTRRCLPLRPIAINFIAQILTYIRAHIDHHHHHYHFRLRQMCDRINNYNS